MATPYDEVFDLFMFHIKDWKLETLFQTNPSDFETVLQGFMVLALPKFENCDQSLARTDSSKTFTETLSEKNKTIIAALMVEKWLEREVQDIRQMNIHLTDRDFKHYSEAQNLKEKSDHWSKVQELNSQTLVDYSLNNRSLWSDWLSGNFYDPNA